MWTEKSWEKLIKNRGKGWIKRTEKNVEKINSGWENTSWNNVFAFKKSLRKTDLDYEAQKIKEN